VLHPRIGSSPHPQTLDKAGKAAMEKHSSLLRESVNYRQKSFIKLGRGDEILYWVDDPYLMWTKSRSEKKSKILNFFRKFFAIRWTNITSPNETWG